MTAVLRVAGFALRIRRISAVHDRKPETKRSPFSLRFPGISTKSPSEARNSEYPSIRDALIAVRNRFHPSIGNADRFVVRIAAGTYDERIRIDGRSSKSSDGRSSKPWPEGITLQGEGEVIIEAAGDEPVVRLANVSRLTIENIQIDAQNKPVAIEVADNLNETQLKKLVVRGFSDVGVLCKGAQGLSFGNSQFLLEQLTFEPDGTQAIGIRFEEGADNDVNSVIVRGCRFLNPMAAGIVIQGRAPYGIEISECLFNRTTDGIRLDGQQVLKSIRFTNNSFRQTRTGIRFSKLPSDLSTDLIASKKSVCEYRTCRGHRTRWLRRG